MIQTFEIPLRLPTMNAMVAANRRSPYAGAGLKKKADADVCWWIKAAGLAPITNPCIVQMIFTEPDKRRDVDNVESAKKFVLDALVKSGVLQGDSPKYVPYSPSFTEYGEGAKVTVVIRDDANIDVLRRIMHRAATCITEGIG